MIPEKEFYSVSDNAHALGGLVAVLGPVALGFDHRYYFAAGIVLFALVKEFWYDEHYETEEVRGSGLRDFLGYCVGVIVGLILLLVFK